MKTKVWAHRGASAYAPENTLEAFLLAAEHGADGVELDVQLTKDGEMVVVHDEEIDRVSDGSGFVKDYTLAELKTLNFNKTHPEYQDVKIPTLREVYEALKGIASKDSVGMVRGYAIVALGDVAVEINKEKEATKFLKNLLKREKTDFAIIDIWAVLYCLGEERWLSYLLEKIDSSKSSERCEVANCLYGIVDEENKEQIKTILQKRREIEKSEEVIESIEEVLNIIKKDYNKKGM